MSEETKWELRALKAEQELGEAHINADRAEQQVKGLQDVLEGCISEFELMADPYMPSARHLTGLEEMVEICKTALSATSTPVGEDGPADILHRMVDRAKAEGLTAEQFKERLFSPHQPETQTVCLRCNGEQTILIESRINANDNYRVRCPRCNGSGTLTPEETNNG